MRIVLALCLLAFGAPSQALGWGSQGHQAIADAAQGRLDEHAQAALARILVGGHSTTLPPGKLAIAATWPDEIRGLKNDIPPGWDKDDIDEANRFNGAHPTSGRWHFVNVPLGAARYPTAADAGTALARFASPDDVVHAINRAIAVLESAAPNPQFSKAQAVRWIVHLAGDIHQPLHVTGGYYDTTPAKLAHPTIIRDPAAAVKPGVLGDRGGNGLKFPGQNPLNLHGFWDSCMVLRVNGEPCTGGNKTYTGLSRKLAKWASAPEATQYQSSGDHHGWAAQWATDALKVAVAADAYTVRLSHGRVVDGAVEARIEASTPQQYASPRIAAAREQLVKATVRLSALLNRISWK
jgi:hypothetical protein